MHSCSPRPHLREASLLAALLTLTVFLTGVRSDFVDLDDMGYIVQNGHIDSLNWHTVRWAFTSFHEANWHPLTMLSLAFDRYLWGHNPLGYHLTNIVVHSGTVALVCCLYSMLLDSKFRHPTSAIFTAGKWRVTASTVAALVFGLHPLRVESVVWASERKDVLCTFFFVASMLVHVMAVKGSISRQSDARILPRDWLLFLFAAMAMMSKPAAVTLPVVLLILDWYPLDRIHDSRSLLRSATEKLPILALSLLTGLLTLLAQRQAISDAVHVSFSSRLYVASKAVVVYLGNMLFPLNLAPLYPHPGNVVGDAAWQYLPYALGVVLLSLGFFTLGSKTRLWWAVWLYYLVTLLPVLGLVQVGGQWMADRYTYLPSLGISLLWGGGGVFLALRLRRKAHPFLCVTVLVVLLAQVLAYGAQTVSYIAVWRNTETLATRVIELFPRQSGAAYYSRAKYRREAGACNEALDDIEQAVGLALRKNLRSRYLDLSVERARILSCLGRNAEALSAAEWGLEASAVPPPPEYLEFHEGLKRTRQSEGPTR